MKRSSLTPWMFGCAGVLALAAVWFGPRTEDVRQVSEPEMVQEVISSPEGVVDVEARKRPVRASSAYLELQSPVCIVGQQLVFTAHAPVWDTSAWAGIIPTHIPHGSEAVNDQHDLSYAYLEGRETVSLTLPCPTQPGEYDLRLHDSDQGGEELVSVRFESKLDPNYVDVKPSLVLLSSAVVDRVQGHGVEVEVQVPHTFSDTAWVGVIPSRVPHGSESTNDMHDIQYFYVQKGAKQRFVFRVPAEVGSYDIRLHDTDSNGREVASVSFDVAGRIKCRLPLER